MILLNCERMKLKATKLPCGKTDMCNGCENDNKANRYNKKQLHKLLNPLTEHMPIYKGRLNMRGGKNGH